MVNITNCRTRRVPVRINTFNLLLVARVEQLFSAALFVWFNVTSTHIRHFYQAAMQGWKPAQEVENWLVGLLVGCLTARKHKEVNLCQLRGGKLAQSAKDGQRDTMHNNQYRRNIMAPGPVPWGIPQFTKQGDQEEKPTRKCCSRFYLLIGWLFNGTST